MLGEARTTSPKPKGTDLRRAVMTVLAALGVFVACVTGAYAAVSQYLAHRNFIGETCDPSGGANLDSRLYSLVSESVTSFPAGIECVWMGADGSVVREQSGLLVSGVSLVALVGATALLICLTRPRRRLVPLLAFAAMILPWVFIIEAGVRL